MTVSASVRFQNFLGNGTTGPFTFDFPVALNDYNVPYITVTKIDADGHKTVLDYTTGYTFSPIKLGKGGGIVTTNAAVPNDGSRLFVEASTPLDQEVSFPNQGKFDAESHEKAFDKVHYILIESAKKTDYAIKIPTTDVSGTATELPSAELRARKAIVFDDSGNVSVSTMDFNDAQAYVDNAAASALSAATSATNAAASETSAASSQTSAATSEANAASSAAAALAAALAAANSVIWSRVSFKTFADSPVTIGTSDDGTFFSIDTSGGPVVLNLPTAASVTLPFNVAVKKTSADGNAITVYPAGTDTIDGDTFKRVSSSGYGTTLLAEIQTDPDTWVSADFGASACNMSAKTFSPNGTDTSFALDVSPGSAENVQVASYGVRQYPYIDYTVSGNVLTFTTPPAAGTNSLLTVCGTTLSIGIPSDGSVTSAKLASGFVAKAIGEVFALWDHLTGVPVPSNSGAQKFVKLTAGLTGATQYNAGLLGSETLSGTFPTNTALATIMTGPLTGQQIHLINTEGGFLRAAAISGVFQQDAMQNIVGSIARIPPDSLNQTSGAFQQTTTGGDFLNAAPTGSIGSFKNSFDASRVARTSDHTRPKNISATFYMRIV